jgi:hypothetical protein
MTNADAMLGVKRRRVNEQFGEGGNSLEAIESIQALQLTEPIPIPLSFSRWCGI